MKYFFCAIFFLFSASPLFAKPQIKDIDALGMTVHDLNLSIRFYTQVLGFSQVAETEVYGEEYENLVGVFDARMRVATLQMGDQLLDLVEFLTPRGRPIPLTSRTNDHWYQHIAIVTTDIEKAYQTLRKHDVQHISNAPQRLPMMDSEEGEVKAFYFEDPDGHPLVLMEYLDEKEKEQWYQESDLPLFVGISHTGFVVSDTDESLKFYRDTLGFRIEGEDVLSGKEVDHLAGVRGSKIKRTKLVAPEWGIPLYLLEFVEPKEEGREVPIDTKANDMWHWQIQAEVYDIKELEELIAKRGYKIASEAVSNFENSFIGVEKAFMARDPDGHALLFYTSKRSGGR